ncbi:origin recognition complex subunit 1 [Phlebotomus argentipes]|uniref:origin recognition complex subunit 1 n=1 Tax=Phlebotomus argentipes TaxID=94469 RepID=UPI0028931EC9|nr:origin recognition complex subunit 1 [Phlebotomus argentipes]
MMNKDYGCPTNVKWGRKLSGVKVKELENREVTFYSSAKCGSIDLYQDACVVVANYKHKNKKGDIGKILHLFCVTDEDYKYDRARVIVQWYSWADTLNKFVTSSVIFEDPEREIVEDWRSYDSNISLGTISGTCNIIHIPEDMSVHSLLADNPSLRDTETLTYICRYKLVRRTAKQYELVPYLNDYSSKRSGKLSEITPHTNPERKQSILARKTVSPIKIVGRSVVRQSTSKSVKRETLDSESSDAENESPNKRRNSDDPLGTPRKRSSLNTSRVRRNLNDSLNQSEDFDTLNYSIVNVENDALKVRLRVSERQKTVPKSPRKRSPQEELKTSPRKSRKSIAATPAVRKSILRTPSSKLNNATPRKSIVFSDIPQESSSARPSRLCTRRQTIGFYCDAGDSPELRTPRGAKAVKTPSTPKSAVTPKASRTTTPSQKMKMLREGVISSTVGNREGPVKGRKSQLEIARDQLHVSTVPKSLPCRENEFKDIFQFLEGKIKDGCGGCMYISGVPGTGKTATVTEVIRCLQANAEKKKLPQFDYLEINGMRLTEPRQAYVHIYRQLQGKTVPWMQAYNFLEKRFRGGATKKGVTVLVVDELDMLCNRRQDVVYNLLDWPSSRTAHLVVVTIANTMDLPERLLKGKVTSRLGLTRLTFKPYSFRQLQQIVTSRLTGFDAFNGDAMQLVARKVAAVSGDARRTLDICRRAVEIAERGGKDVVAMNHVEQALAEMIANPKVQAIKACSKMEQFFLQAVIAESLRTGVEETTFMGVYAQFQTIISITGHLTPTVSRSLEICSRLGAYRLLIGQHSSTDLAQKVLLNVSPDDVHYALQDKTA